jgi:Leucine-rich repeat (LRR) protein
MLEHQLSKLGLDYTISDLEFECLICGQSYNCGFSCVDGEDHQFFESKDFEWTKKELSEVKSKLFRIRSFNYREFKNDAFKFYPNLFNLEIKYESKASDTIPSGLNVLNSFSSLTNLRKLSLSACFIERIINNPFSNLKNLIWLDLSNNSIEQLDHDMLRGLSALKHLFINGNKLSEINNKTFKHMKNLIEINLSNNKLVGKLSSKLFGPLINLKVLLLNDNQITEIKSSTFRNQSRMTYLNFSNNKLSEIKKTDFSELVHLKLVDLGQNLINKIDKDSFKNLVSLVYLYLSNNQIEVLEEGLFQRQVNLEHLHLDNNKIERISCSAFGNSVNLKSFDLSNNKINNRLTKDFFGKLNKLKYLNLIKNNFSGIDDNALDSFDESVLIYLSRKLFEKSRVKNFCIERDKLECEVQMYDESDDSNNNTKDSSIYGPCHDQIVHYVVETEEAHYDGYQTDDELRNYAFTRKIKRQITKQIEYYFGYEHLSNICYTRSIMDKAGFVRLSQINNFPTMRAFRYSCNKNLNYDKILVSAVCESKKVEVCSNSQDLNNPFALENVLVRTAIDPTKWPISSSEYERSGRYHQRRYYYK